jgi:hypothetical protein
VTFLTFVLVLFEGVYFGLGAFLSMTGGGVGVGGGLLLVPGGLVVPGGRLTIGPGGLFGGGLGLGGGLVFRGGRGPWFGPKLITGAIGKIFGPL